MALESPSRPARSGLSSQVATLTEGLASLVATLEPDTLAGPDAAALYAALAQVERLVVAAKCLLAPRIASSGLWEARGHRSPARMLAEVEGISPGQANRTLMTGRRLAELPATEAALRAGRLSGAKAAEIAGAASVDPASEAALLAGSPDESLAATTERCRRARAGAARHDPVATARAIHAARHFSHWHDAEGAFCFSGQDSPERGAALLARLVPAAHRLRDARRAATTGPSPVPPESEGALRADALVALVTGSSTWVTGTDDAGADPGADPDDAGEIAPATRGTDDVDAATRGADNPTVPRRVSRGWGTPGLRGADDIVDRLPTATVMVRVDRDALVRGHTLPGELCDLDGAGPIPVPLARALAVDSFLALVFTEAGDIRAVHHRGRTINATLRTALAFRDRCCVVPGCAMPYGLEIDHIRPVALGGPTALDNLALLCTHHHRLKTYDGWVLERHGPSDEDPRWSFTPQPDFGQEPDLGLDRPGAEPMPRPPRRVPGTDPPPDGTLFDESRSDERPADPPPRK